MEPLSSTWINQLCMDVGRDRQLVEKRNAVYDITRVRYLGLKKFTRKDVVKRNVDELRKAKEDAEDARYAMLLKLNEVPTPGACLLCLKSTC